jgi:excisionase family DNA binding protein
MVSYIFNKIKMKTEKLPDILTLKQASELLNCHPNTLRNWDQRGLLKAIRFGSRGDRRYKKEDVFKLINHK